MKPLEGRVIAITRDESDAAEFSEMVQREGGTTIALNTIEIVPAGSDVARRFLDRVLAARPDYCAFMSAQAVRVLSELADKSRIQEALEKTAVIAVGPKTKAELERTGVTVSLMPLEYSSKGLVEMLLRVRPPGKKIMIPRSSAAGDYASQRLRAAGMVVEEVFLYDVRASGPSPEWEMFAGQLRSGRIDAVVFTSASSVAAFFEILASVLDEKVQLDEVSKVISIGPFTSEELKRRNLSYFEANEHTLGGTFELAKKLLFR